MKNFTYDEIKEAQDYLIKVWGEDGKAVIATIFNRGSDELLSSTMSMKEFLQCCTCCGGNWGGMLLTGIKKLFPSVWNAIPDYMGDYAFPALCYTIMLCGIDTKKED